MALPDQQEPVLQTFISESFRPLGSLPTHLCAAKERYVLWQDIQNLFPNIDHLKYHWGPRILFMMDNERNLHVPLRIEKDKYAFTVIFQAGAESAESDPFLDIKRLLKSNSDLFQEMQSDETTPRWRFENTLAVVRYYHDLILKELERLEGVGVIVQLQGQDSSHIRQELEGQREQAIALEQKNVCENMFRSLHHSLDAHAPRLFVVLPSNIDSWNDSDPATRTFRLYFICDFEKKRISKSLCLNNHFTDHPGYELQRPQEFFRTYGTYVQRILMMVIHGFSNGDHYIPPLDTYQILWGLHSADARSRLSKQNIEALVHTSYTYLQNLLPTTWISKVNLDASETRAVKEYLRVPHGDSGLGTLYRHFRDNSFFYWECRSHALRNANVEALWALEEFVLSHGGRFDLQQASLHLELSSVQQAIEFRRLFRTIRHKLEVSFRLVLEASRTFLEEFIQDIAKYNAAALELDGVTLAIHPQDSVNFGCDMFAQLMHDSELQMVALLDYPQPQDQTLYLSVKFGCVCSLRFISSNRISGIQWQCLKVELAEFLELHLEKARGTVKDPASESGTTLKDPMADSTQTIKDQVAVLSELKGLIDRYGLAEVTEISFYAHKQWLGRFNCDAGEIRQAQINNAEFPGILMSGSLRQLTVDFMDRDFTEQPLESIVLSNKWLQKLDILICEQDIFSWIERLIAMWTERSTTLLLTLFERAVDQRGRVVAQVVIEGQTGKLPGDGVNSGPSGTEELLSVIDFRHWDCDRVGELLSDGTATLLDLVTRKHPLVLKCFTINITDLTHGGLERVQNVLRRSRPERLRIHCSRIPSHLIKSIYAVLQSIQWASLRSLALYGDHVDEWLELWPIDIENPCAVLPQLSSLEIVGFGATPQQISHKGALLLHLWNYSLVELRLENIYLHKDQDADLINNWYASPESRKGKAGFK